MNGEVATRSLASGVLTEIIHWRGRRDQMTKESLDRFVEKFPIESDVPIVPVLSR